MSRQFLHCRNTTAVTCLVLAVAFATALPAAGPLAPAGAVETLTLADGLEATLLAAEPLLSSPSNIDIDAAGRVWVCEVVNYRGKKNTRETGDRILVLEDTDGDGNRGVRINWVMEYGNYGYVDELTGAGWRIPRTNLEAEVPLQHWHQNDPGVVPNLLLTGGGSPTGICVYEGSLLPVKYWGQLIHCDAGPNVVRAYLTKPAGAGSAAVAEPLIDGSADRWFRPSDVCIAPDGSLLVADWYDPGVGGHGMAYTEKGRIYRIAPAGSRWSVPKVDLNTVAGAVAALASPSLSTRATALERLQAEPAAAVPLLTQAYETAADPIEKARLAWAWGMLPGQASTVIERLAGEADDRFRVFAVRMSRLVGGNTPGLVDRLCDLLTDLTTRTPESLALLRSLDFRTSAATQAAVAAMLPGYAGSPERLPVVLPELVLRVGEAGRTKELIRKRAAEAASMVPGTGAFVDIIERFSLADHSGELVTLAASISTNTGLTLRACQTTMQLAGIKPITAWLTARAAAAAAVALSRSRWDEVRKAGADLLPLPKASSGQPLPPLAELLKKRGNASAGKAVFTGAGTCAKCHVVAGEGKAVGPDLTGIGAKLSRQAVYESILAPSAAISHNYETHALLTEDGRVITGLLVSQTDEQVVLKTAEGVDVTTPTATIDELARQPISLMPADIAATLKPQQLVDLVTWLETLRATR